MKLEEEKKYQKLFIKRFSHCIYFMDVLIRKICGINFDWSWRKKKKEVHSAIFGFVDVQDQNYLLFDHLLLTFKCNIYNSRVNKLLEPKMCYMWSKMHRKSNK